MDKDEKDRGQRISTLKHELAELETSACSASQGSMSEVVLQRAPFFIAAALGSYSWYTLGCRTNFASCHENYWSMMLDWVTKTRADTGFDGAIRSFGWVLVLCQAFISFVLAPKVHGPLKSRE